MERCARSYGDCFTVRLAQVGTFAFVSRPELLKQVFTESPERLRAGAANKALEPLLGSRSVLLLDGREHLRQRRLMLPPFHGQHLRGYESLIEQIAAEEIERWRPGQALRLRPRMQAITLEAILRVVFGMEAGTRTDLLRGQLQDLLRVASRPWAMIPPLRRDLGPLSPWVRFVRVREAVDATLYDEIARRRADPDLAERGDVFSLLLQARDADGEPLTDHELRDELVTLLVAGHETTATALAWAFERLVRHPAALDRLRGGEGDYADAAAHETLRLRPPLPVVARQVAGDPYELAGFTLPAGTLVAPCIYLAHRRADLYPDPYAFRPERFLGSAPETYSWLPFGGGVRRCIGASFALLEMSVVLRAVAQRVRLEAARPAPEPVSRRAIILAPRDDGSVVVA